MGDVSGVNSSNSSRRTASGFTCTPAELKEMENDPTDARKTLRNVECGTPQKYPRKPESEQKWYEVTYYFYRDLIMGKDK